MNLSWYIYSKTTSCISSWSNSSSDINWFDELIPPNSLNDTFSEFNKLQSDTLTHAYVTKSVDGGDESRIMKASAARLVRIIPRKSLDPTSIRVLDAPSPQTQDLQKPTVFELLQKQRETTGSDWPGNIRIEPVVKKEVYRPVQGELRTQLKRMLKERWVPALPIPKLAFFDLFLLIAMTHQRDHQ